MNEKSKFATRAIHAGQTPDPTYHAIMTPIFQTSTYVQESPGKYPGDYDYARAGNPTRTALQENLASLEQAKFGLCYGSGQAAQDAVIHLLEAGDHVLLCDDVYGGTFRLFDKVFKRLGISFTRVDMTDLNKTKAEFTSKTKLVWIESPTNPLLKIIDIQKICELSRAHKAISVVDNTFASPYLQNPLLLGADIVAHSATKYIGGHSDVIGGALMLNDKEFEEKLRFIQKAVGAVPSPLDCFLLLRSTKTLHVRMERHCSNARKLTDYLVRHPKIEKVYYPGLETHPGHAIAKKQMKDFGGIISVLVKGDVETTKKFMMKTKVFSLAESLGGVESLANHPALMTHASIPAEQRAALGITDNLVRLSVGIEDVDDLLADLEQALG
jgi:cystathionine gamma-lyase